MVDNKDMLILNALKEDAKASIAKIAKKTGLPGTTVHNHIKRMRKKGIIKAYTIKVDNKKLGLGIAAYIEITVDYNFLKQNKMSQHELAEQIGKLPFVEQVSILAGGCDIIVKTRVKDIDGLNNFVTNELRNYDGVEKTQTMVILSEVID